MTATWCQAPSRTLRLPQMVEPALSAGGAEGDAAVVQGQAVVAAVAAAEHVAVDEDVAGDPGRFAGAAGAGGVVVGHVAAQPDLDGEVSGPDVGRAVDQGDLHPIDLTRPGPEEPQRRARRCGRVVAGSSAGAVGAGRAARARRGGLRGRRSVRARDGDDAGGRRVAARRLARRRQGGAVPGRLGAGGDARRQHSRSGRRPPASARRRLGRPSFVRLHGGSRLRGRACRRGGGF